MTIEICADSLDQVIAARQSGAARVELCSALEVGGLTPGPGLTTKCALIQGIEIHSMIRPRAGGFSYNPDELVIMDFDIRSQYEGGAKGVVFGILDEDGSLNIPNNKKLLTKAKSLGLETTFHRAFDLTSDPFRALEQIIEMGFDRILTSGLHSTAIEGIEVIRDLVLRSNGRIQIMAGSGVNPGNIVELQKTGIDAVHFSARKPTGSLLKFNMGQEFVADIAKISGILKALEM